MQTFPSRNLWFGIGATALFVAATLVFGLTAVGTASAATPGRGQCSSLFVSEVHLDQIVDRSATAIDGRTVYFEHIRASKNRPTAVVFMGLFTPMSDFAEFQREFVRQRRGEGLLIFANSTQVESLMWRSEVHKLPFEDSAVDLTDLIREATAAVVAAGIQGPVTAIGYSLGSAPAVRFAKFHRERVDQVVLAAPFVEAGDHASQLLSAKFASEAFAKLNLVFGPAMLENTREMAAENTATTIINKFLSVQPLPESVGRDTAIQALKALIRSVETFNLTAEVRDGLPFTTFVLAEKEDSPRLRLQREASKAVEAVTGAAAVKVIEGGEHEILTDKPRESVELVLEAMRASRRDDSNFKSER